MGKVSGLGSALYLSGNDLSGDMQAIDKISSPIAMLDVTDITESAFERITGLHDGQIQVTTFWNPSRAHPVLSALPTSDQLVSFASGVAIGSTVVNLQALQLNYDGTRAANGMYTFKVTADGDGFGMEWGNLLTPGVRTDVAATNGTDFDSAAGFSTPAVPLSTVPYTNPAPIPATVVVSGGTVSNVSVNGVTVGSGDGTYTVPQGGTITLTYSAAPTWTWTPQTFFGASLYLHVNAFTGTDVTMKLQDSADNITFNDVTGGGFTAVVAAPGYQRIALGTSATLRRYLRIATTTSGGFTSVSFVAAVCRNLASVVY